MIFIIYLFVLVLLVFGYHYERNGDPIPLGDFLSRIFWGISFSIGYLACSLDRTNPWMAAFFVFSQFIAMLIPHAFAMNMGKRTQLWIDMTAIKVFGNFTLPKWWPAYWLKPFLTDLNFFEQDFIGMQTVGLLRGLVVFGLPIALGWIGLTAGLIAVVINMLWQPLSYTLGNMIPLNIWTNKAYSSTWGEFLIAFGWAFSIYIITLP